MIEIISPSNIKTQLREYTALCLANGCEEFWALDHKTETVTVTTKNGHSVSHSTGIEMPINLLGGTAISVNQIFS